MLMKIGVVSTAAAFFVLAVGVKADELRVKDWPNGVPCSALQHKSDGSWTLSDTVIGPDSSRHYPNPDRQSRENIFFGQKCGGH
jgi:hypothetical protein